MFDQKKMYEDICTLNDTKILSLERDLATKQEMISDLESTKKRMEGEAETANETIAAKEKSIKDRDIEVENLR